MLVTTAVHICTITTITHIICLSLLVCILFFLPVLLLLQHHPRNTSLSPLLTIIDTPPCCWRPYYFETMEDNTNKKVLGIYCHQCGSDSWVNIGEVMGFPYMRCESLHCIETRNPDFCSFCSLRDCRIDNISQQKVRSHNSQCHETSQKRRCLSLPLPSESHKSDSPNGSKSDVTVQQQPMMGADDILEYDNDHDTLVKDVEEGSNYNDDGGDDDVVIVGGGIADYGGDDDVVIVGGGIADLSCGIADLSFLGKSASYVSNLYCSSGSTSTAMSSLLLSAIHQNPTSGNPNMPTDDQKMMVSIFSLSLHMAKGQRKNLAQIFKFIQAKYDSLLSQVSSSAPADTNHSFFLPTSTTEFNQVFIKNQHSLFKN
jgi:hypothetical protein